MENQQLRILIVDDDVLLGKIIRYKLGRFHALAEHVTSREDIIGAYKKMKPDIVVMDPVLDTVSGFDIVQDLPDRKASIIFFTILDDPSDRKRAVKLGIDYFLNKNEATMDDLLQTVAAAAIK